VRRPRAGGRQAADSGVGAPGAPNRRARGAPRRFDDEVALCGAPIEDHHPGADTTWRYLPDGEGVGIPCRTLLVRDAANVLAASRCRGCRTGAEECAGGHATRPHAGGRVNPIQTRCHPVWTVRSRRGGAILSQTARAAAQ